MCITFTFSPTNVLTSFLHREQKPFFFVTHNFPNGRNSMISVLGVITNQAQKPKNKNKALHNLAKEIKQ